MKVGLINFLGHTSILPLSKVPSFCVALRLFFQMGCLLGQSFIVSFTEDLTNSKSVPSTIGSLKQIDHKKGTLTFRTGMINYM